ncbi:MAG: amino acid adenylation domain-containing protein [Calditrichaeota bacterium]|nr:MAG: amino acid adenylation domain-containing protein [Calditrichota bacterium]MBL1204443.1 amino acid adenylation domain-containing protein [Calditrichota bacterium]NOG44272.1 amino acid adenylation domain-containing protein [Calditrichota bacterium]
MENIQDIYPLSPMQQGMLFHTLYAPETEAYSEQISCQLNGRLNVDAFKRAWQEVLNRHDILRSAFIWEDVDEPLQVVHQQLDIPFELIDWTDKSEELQKKSVKEFANEQRKIGFELNSAPLISIKIIRLNEKAYHFVLTHHHLLWDGWASPLILGEVFKLYDAYDNGNEIQLETPRPYSDYIGWLQQQDMEQAKAFWKNRLDGISAPTPLSVNKVSHTGESEYKVVSHNFDEQVSTKLQALAKEQQITLNTIMQGTWGLLLARYGRLDDVVFGATVSGRPAEIPGIETMVGLFINTLPVRIRVNEASSFLQLFQNLQMEQAETRQFEYSPLVEIQGQTEIPRDMPLFESLLVFENYPVDEAMQQQDSELSISGLDSFERTNFPLTLVSAPGKQVVLKVAYETAQFSDETIQRLFTHFENLLQAFVENPNQNPTKIPVLSQKEKQLTLNEWNNTKSDYPEDLTIHQKFEQIAEQFPDETAIVGADPEATIRISYRELNERANQLARFLKEKGVSKENVIAICLDRSPEMVIASLAVLKAGGAYVPIDSTYPPERIEYIIKESRSSYLISTSGLEKIIPAVETETIFLDQIDEKLTASKENLNLEIDPFNLAYIIYTSGSTGKPKGVMLRHGGLLNTVQAQAQDFKIDNSSRVMQFSSFSFDASVSEIFVALLNGAELHLSYRETILSKSQLTQFLNDRQISIITFPPSMLAVLADEQFPHLKTVVTVGEACPIELAEKWRANTRFINGYGPTEATVGCVWGEINKPETETLTAPIGKPIINDQVYLLDENFNPVPIGVAGELCIASPGLARGYLNNPDLTAEKFIPNPFSENPGSCLYRTGDLARWLVDGRLEYTGRIDFQVKIRGNRIELGEIESVLSGHNQVREVIVLAIGDNTDDKKLVAYIVAENNEHPEIQSLKDFIKKDLPEYMVPLAFLNLEAFPLTSSGKIDRRALPKPDSLELSSSVEFVAPRNQVEELLAGLWGDILKVSRVGINDNFFDLGGHSLLATQLISRIRDAFDVELPLKALFDDPTIANLTTQIDVYKSQGSGNDIPPIEKADRSKDMALSFSQQRLWFLDQLQPGGSFYNIPSAFKLKGKLNLEALQKSIDKLILRHEVFRTTFADKSGTPVQVIADNLELKLEIEDLSQHDNQSREIEIQKIARAEATFAFNLASGPLIRIRLIKSFEDEHVVFFTVHHIISDGWSMGIMVSEIATFYAAFSIGNEPQIADLPIQFADYAEWQKNWLQGEVLETQLNYWKEKIGTNPPVLELPIDHQRPAVQTFSGNSVTKEISAELSQQIKQLSSQAGVTPFMTLLAAFQSLLHRYSGQDEIIVGSPIANRRHSETEQLIGFFVNNLILKNSFADDPEFGDLLRQARETTLGSYAHQDIPFEQLVDAMVTKREMSHSAIFQVMFVFQNLPETGIDLPDLRMESLYEETSSSKFDLSVTMSESTDSMIMSFEYNTDLFEQSTIERMMSHFENLITSVVQDSEQVISEIDYFDPSEKQTMVFDWNNTDSEFESEFCVHQKFEQHVQINPDAAAVVFGEKQLSYKELSDQADLLAAWLLDNGIQPDDRVGICMDRSFEMVIGIIAALKAGAAFLPLDPAYPQERLDYMVEDSGLKVLLTNQKSNVILNPVSPGEESPEEKNEILRSVNYAQNDIKVLNVDNFDFQSQNKFESRTDITPDNLAYVIYTSGSTGKPKGTLLAHRGLVNLAKEQQKAFNIDSESRILQFSSLSFDAAVWETVMALLNGAALSLVDRSILASGDQLVETLKNQKITTVTLPPSVLAIFPETDLPDLKTIITAGEKCTTDLIKKWAPGRQFYNAYGPTETTVCASMFLTDPDSKIDPPIGKANGNFQLYVLDRNGFLCPVGVAGELCVGGVGLARGYHNRPDLTAEKFIPDTFSGKMGERLYRTGDLVRYLPDGNIDFLGRIDHQVKVRGFRIELGEIEASLREIREIVDVIVLAREDKPGEKRLVAYFVSSDTEKTTIPMLREILKSSLPDYMVPSVFMPLDAMPLTPNGKIDRKVLSVPEQDRSQATAEYVAPRNETETILNTIVEDLLKLEKAGVYDNFFELGGHSLLATQFMSRVREKFDIELPLLTLFEKPTVAELADAVEVAKASGIKAKPQIQKIDRGSRAARRPARKSKK